jgi:ferredoxin-NADP reductase
MKPAEPWPARLVEVIAVNPEVRQFVFDFEDGARFDFIPGQHVCLGKTIGGARAQSYYSLASEPAGSSRFEICAKVSPQGEGFGRMLAGVERGEKFDVVGPSGAFRLKEPPGHSLFVAGGTGLAPLRSMLRSLLARPGGSKDLELTLLFGTRRPDWGYYLAEFAELEKRSPNFRFLHTVSRAGDNWTGRRGYVQDHLKDALAGRSREVDLYMCGRPAMMRDLPGSLERAGFDIGALFYEQYG